MTIDEFIDYVMSVIEKHGYSRVQRDAVASFVKRQMATI